MNEAPLNNIEDSIIIERPIERAWRVMTAADYVPRWLGCLNYEERVGHVFYMQPDAQKRAEGDIAGATHCEILEYDAPRLFRFSWYLPGAPKTEVAIELTSVEENKTRATLTHSGWDQFAANEIRAVWEMLAKGWKSAVLPNLKSMAETADK